MGWDQWIRTVEVAAGFPAAEAAANERHVEALLRTGCRIFHVDGSGRDAVDAVALLGPLVRRYDGVLDVHGPKDNFDEFRFAGANNITFDATGVDDVSATIDAVHEAGLLAGVAYTQGPVDGAAGADLVLCTCQDSNLVETVREFRTTLPDTVTIEVEGDVSHDNLRSLYLAGATVLVADEPIFSREDLPRSYRRLVQALA